MSTHPIALDGVLFSHTSKQGNAYERPVAALRSGRPTRFLTGLYGDKLPWWLLLAARCNARAAGLVRRCAEKRMHPALPGRYVVSTSGAICEGIRLGLGWIPFSDRFHDAATALWLCLQPDLRSHYAIFHGFQDSCRWSLSVARRRGLTTVIEVILPPLRKADCRTEPRTRSVARRSLRKSERAARSLARQIAGADHVIVQSRFSVPVLSQLWVPRAKLHVVDLGVDTGRFTPRREPRLSPDSLELLFVGQIGFRKGIDVLVDALDLLFDLPLTLTAVGHVVDSVGRDAVRSCDRLLYAGVAPDAELLRLYRTSDLLVIPSRAEGGCNVVMEALACGLPCVVAEGAVSVIRDGADGWVVPNNDPRALARLLRGLYGRRREWAEWSGRARATALRHTWEAYHRSLDGLYSSLEKPGQRPRP